MLNVYFSGEMISLTFANSNHTGNMIMYWFFDLSSAVENLKSVEKLPSCNLWKEVTHFAHLHPALLAVKFYQNMKFEIK